jgi:hypothetical protein
MTGNRTRDAGQRAASSYRAPQATTHEHEKRETREALIDAGVRAGVPSVESDELAAARQRICRLEAELALTRDACALFNEQVVVTPQGKSRWSKG